MHCVRNSSNTQNGVLFFLQRIKFIGPEVTSVSDFILWKKYLLSACSSNIVDTVIWWKQCIDTLPLIKLESIKVPTHCNLSKQQKLQIKLGRYLFFKLRTLLNLRFLLNWIYFSLLKLMMLCDWPCIKWTYVTKNRLYSVGIYRYIIYIDISNWNLYGTSTQLNNALIYKEPCLKFTYKIFIGILD